MPFTKYFVCSTAVKQKTINFVMVLSQLLDSASITTSYNNTMLRTLDDVSKLPVLWCLLCCCCCCPDEAAPVCCWVSSSSWMTYAIPQWTHCLQCDHSCMNARTHAHMHTHIDSTCLFIYPANTVWLLTNKGWSWWPGSLSSKWWHNRFLK